MENKDDKNDAWPERKDGFVHPNNYYTILHSSFFQRATPSCRLYANY